MPSVPSHRAIATKATIEILFAMAQADGECTIHLDSHHAALLVRRKCYAYRSQVRKNSRALTGIETSPFDAYTFPMGELESGKWWLTITSSETVEFELIVPADTAFDVSKFEFIDTDVPQLSVEDHEAQFEQAVDEFMDEGILKTQ